jgi:hypothetical protein
VQLGGQPHSLASMTFLDVTSSSCLPSESDEQASSSTSRGTASRDSATWLTSSLPICRPDAMSAPRSGYTATADRWCRSRVDWLTQPRPDERGQANPGQGHERSCGCAPTGDWGLLCRVDPCGPTAAYRGCSGTPAPADPCFRRPGHHLAFGYTPNLWAELTGRGAAP